MGMTRDEVRLALAERLSVPCPRCGGPCPHGERCGCFHSAIHACHTNPDYKRLPLVSECENCAGTGGLWPLREPCARCKGKGRTNQKRWAPGCEACGGRPMTLGRGWVPKEMHLEDLLTAMEAAGYEWRGASDGSYKGWLFLQDGRSVSQDADPYRAALAALPK